MDTPVSTIEPSPFRSKTQDNDSLLEVKPVCFQDMPFDVLEHIISFLSVQSILNLMVNKALRQICEQSLYREIRVISSGRAFHLCKTFVLRPDLALLVRDLEVAIPLNHVFRTRGEYQAQALPTFSREGEEGTFTLVGALALAKNVRSFHAMGSGWAADRHPTPLRDIICGMKLTRLQISNLSLLVNQDPKRDEKYMSYFRAILQAQPLLEILELPNTTAIAGWIEHPNPQSIPAFSLLPENTSSPRIKSSDVPNLRSLVANTSVAASFLTIASKLESLSIRYWDNQLPYFLLHAERLGHQIWSLSLKLPWREFMGWDGIGNVLRCFPNVETLVVETWWTESCEGQQSGRNFLGQASQKIHLLPLLRKLEVYYETSSETEVPIDLEITREQLTALKTSCPLLEYVIDPMGKIWAYTTSTNHECAGLHTLGHFVREPYKSLKDIPYTSPNSQDAS